MKKQLLLISILFLFGKQLTSAQTYDWAFQVGAIFRGSHGYSARTDSYGSVFLAGEFNGSMDFDPGPAPHFLFPNTIPYLAGFIAKYDAAGNYMWAESISGDDADATIRYMELDDYGNLYVAGFFSDTIDVDPGPGVHNLICHAVPNNYDIFIAKYDTAGNFKWGNSIRINFQPSIQKVILNIDKQMNVYLTSSYQDTAVFTSTNGTQNIDSSDWRDIFIVKYDSVGNNKWVHLIGGSNNQYPSSAQIDDAGNFYFCTYYDSTMDFDPGAAVHTLPGMGFCIAKYDSSGSYSSVRSIAKYGNGSSSGNYYITLDQAGNIYITGLFNGTIDFDPGPAIYKLKASPFNNAQFVAKYDTACNYIWARAMGSTNGHLPIVNMPQLDTAGNFYLSGSLEGTVDFDISPGIYNLSSPATGNDDLFFAKYDSSGNFINAFQIVDLYTTSDFNTHYIDKSGNIFISGSFGDTTDMDPGPGIQNLIPSSGACLFLVKYSQGPCGLVGLGIHANDITCTMLTTTAIADIVNGVPPYSYSWNTIPVTNNDTALITNPGIYTLTASDNGGCVFTHPVAINGSSMPTGFDLDANLAASRFRVGRPTNLFIDAFNNGCVLTSGSLKVIIDTTIVTFLSSNPPPDQIAGDTLIWNFTSLSYDSLHVAPDFITLTSLSANLGDTVKFHVIIDPVSGDADSLNNDKIYYFTVTGSYDPNIKEVYPQGAGVNGYIANNQKMTYTVCFQNTGTAEALDVTILDTLSANLNLQSVHIVGSSDTVSLYLLTGNVLAFLFKDINLPDSTTNEPASHGYVIFEADQAPNLPPFTQITNTAAIYFDYNAPVMTNTILNTIESPVAVEQLSPVNNQFTIYPNPAINSFTIKNISQDENSLLQVLNPLGEIVYSKKLVGKSEYVINHHFSKGIYFVRLSSQMKRMIQKLIIE